MTIQAVHFGDSGPKVETLHRNLLYLIRHQGGMIKETRSALEAELADDVATKSYGLGTTSVVGIFQYQIRNRGNLPLDLKKKFANIPLGRKDDGRGNGDVDDLTAEALDWLVKHVRAREKK